MEDRDYIAIASKPIKVKKTIFMSIGLGCLGLAVLLILIFILALAFGDAATKEQSGGLIAAMIVFGILFGVPGLVMLILMGKQLKLLKDEAKLLEDGRKIYDAQQKSKAIKEEKKAIKEAEQLALEETRKEGLTPDIEVNKEFKGAQARVWVNLKNKLIQFSLPSGEFVSSKDKGKFIAWLFNAREEILKKTKVLNLDDLDDIKLVHETQLVTETDLDGIRVKGDYIASGSGKITRTSTTYHYYQVEFMFKDIDYPVVHIFFNNDREQAETLYQTVKILTNK